jgi:hypothetical protein
MCARRYHLDEVVAPLAHSRGCSDTVISFNLSLISVLLGIWQMV